MRKVFISIVVAMLVFVTDVQAEDAERNAVAEQLLVTMEIQKTIEKSFEMVKQMIPAQMKQTGASDEATSAKAQDAMQKMMDVVMEEMSWDKLKDDYISIYAETFTAEELKGLLQFYESPVGKKFIEKQPEIMQRSMQVSQKQMAKLMPKIQELTQQLTQELTQQESTRHPSVDYSAFTRQGPDSNQFADLTLSDDPSPEEVKQYIADIVSASQGQNTFSDRDPQVALLMRVGRDNLPLLIEALSTSRSMKDYHLKQAIIKLADESSQSLILDALPIHYDLVAVVIRNGWEKDAKNILLTELKDAGPFLPIDWIKAVANLNEPEIYPLLRENFINGQNRPWVYKAIKDLPIEDLPGAVNEAWKRSQDDDHFSRTYMAMIAVTYGHLDALAILVDSLTSDTPDSSWISQELRPIVLQHIDFRGSNVELENWFKTNRDHLRFDPKSSTFIIATEVE